MGLVSLHPLIFGRHVHFATIIVFLVSSLLCAACCHLTEDPGHLLPRGLLWTVALPSLSHSSLSNIIFPLLYPNLSILSYQEAVGG